MYKYLIVNSKLAFFDTFSERMTYPVESIVGTIISKSRWKALSKSVDFTPDPIVAIYSSLAEWELELAKQSPILWEQPESNPVTLSNPKGAGARRLAGTLTQLSVKLRLSEEGAKWYRSQRSKSSAIVKLIEQAAKAEVPIAIIEK